MNNRIVTISVVIFILLVVGGIIYMKNFQGAAIQNTATADEAKWIGEHSVLYYQPNCIHCKNQEKLFGENLKYLNMVDCTTSKGIQECADKGIIGTPTWIINEQKYEGELTIDELKNLTGYK